MSTTQSPAASTTSRPTTPSAVPSVTPLHLDLPLWSDAAISSAPFYAPPRPPSPTVALSAAADAGPPPKSRRSTAGGAGAGANGSNGPNGPNAGSSAIPSKRSRRSDARTRTGSASSAGGRDEPPDSPYFGPSGLYTDPRFGQPPLPATMAPLVDRWERLYPAYIRSATGANVALPQADAGASGKGGGSGGASGASGGDGDPSSSSTSVPPRRKSMSRHSSAHDLNSTSAASLAVALSATLEKYIGAAATAKSSVVLPAIPAVHVPVVHDVNVRIDAALAPLPHPLQLFVDAKVEPGTPFTDVPTLISTVAAHVGASGILRRKSLVFGTGPDPAGPSATADGAQGDDASGSKHLTVDDRKAKRTRRKSASKRRLSGHPSAAGEPDVEPLPEMWKVVDEGLELEPASPTAIPRRLSAMPAKVVEERVVDVRDVYGLVLPSVRDETIMTLAWVFRLLHIKRKTLTAADFLWENLYPQVNGVPVYNPAGKYVLKVFVAGTAYALAFDDQLPVSAAGEVLLPRSIHRNEVWPWLIGKALLVLQAKIGATAPATPTDAAPRTLSALHRFLRQEPSASATPWFLSYLSGWVPTTIQIPHPTHASELAGERVWELLDAAISAAAMTVAETHVNGKKHVYVCLQTRIHPVHGRQLLVDTATPPKPVHPPPPPTAAPGTDAAAPPLAPPAPDAVPRDPRRVRRRPTLVDMARLKRSELIRSPTPPSSSSASSDYGYYDDSDNESDGSATAPPSASASASASGSATASAPDHSPATGPSVTPPPASLAPPASIRTVSFAAGADSTPPTSALSSARVSPVSELSGADGAIASPLPPAPATFTLDDPVRLPPPTRHPVRIRQKTPEWVSYLDFMELFSVAFVFRNPRDYAARLATTVLNPAKDILMPPRPAHAPDQLGDLGVARHAPAVLAQYASVVRAPLRAYHSSYVGAKHATLSAPGTSGALSGDGEGSTSRSSRSRRRHATPAPADGIAPTDADGAGPTPSSSSHRSHHHHHHHADSSHRSAAVALDGSTSSLRKRSSRASAAADALLNSTSESVKGLGATGDIAESPSGLSTATINPFTVAGRVRSSMLLHVIVGTGASGAGAADGQTSYPPPNELCLVLSACGTNAETSSVVLNGFDWRDRGNRPTLALVEAAPGETGSTSVHLRPGSHTYTIHVNGGSGDSLLFLGGALVRVYVAPRRRVLETFLGVHVQEFAGRIPSAPDNAWSLWFKFNMRVGQQLHMSAQLSVDSAEAAQYAQLSIVDHSRADAVSTPLLHTALAQVYKPVAATGADALYTIQASCVAAGSVPGARWRLRLLSDKPFVPELEETRQTAERGVYRKRGRAWRTGVLFRFVLSLKDGGVPSAALALHVAESTARVSLTVLAVDTSIRGVRESELDATATVLAGSDGFGTVVLPFVNVDLGATAETHKLVVVGAVDDDTWTGAVVAANTSANASTTVPGTPSGGGDGSRRDTERLDRSLNRSSSKRRKRDKSRDKRSGRDRDSRSDRSGDRTAGDKLLLDFDADESRGGADDERLPWSLAVYTETGAVLEEDTARAEELAAIKAAWETAEPGRAARGERVRAAWLSGSTLPAGTTGSDEGRGRLSRSNSRSGSRMGSRKARKKRNSANTEPEKSDVHPAIDDALAATRSDPVVWAAADGANTAADPSSDPPVPPDAAFERARLKEWAMANVERDQRNTEKKKFIRELDSLASRLHRYRARDARLRTEYRKRKADEAAAAEAARLAAEAAAEEARAKKEEEERRRSGRRPSSGGPASDKARRRADRRASSKSRKHRGDPNPSAAPSDHHRRSKPPKK